MTDCIFCKIVKGEIPSYKVYEDEKFFTFLDIRPWTPGHTLIIPKKHHDYLFDYNDKEYTELMLTAKTLSNKIKKVTNAKRIGVAVEGFAVNHLHIHLIPINSGEDFDPHNAKSISNDELLAMQEKLKDL